MSKVMVTVADGYNGDLIEVEAVAMTDNSIRFVCAQGGWFNSGITANREYKSGLNYVSLPIIIAKKCGRKDIKSIKVID